MKILTLATFDGLSRDLDCQYPLAPAATTWITDYNFYHYYWYTLQPRIKEAFTKAEQRMPNEGVVPSEKIVTEEFRIDGNYFYVTKCRATYYLLQADMPLSNAQACALTLPFRNYLKQQHQQPIKECVATLEEQYEHSKDHDFSSTHEKVQRVLQTKAEIKRVLLLNIEKMISNMGKIEDLVLKTSELAEQNKHLSFRTRAFQSHPKKTFWKDRLSSCASSLKNFFSSLFCCARPTMDDAPVRHPLIAKKHS